MIFSSCLLTYSEIFRGIFVEKNIDLTKGPISQKIFNFTLPIIGTSFINMLYSFVDMACIGRIGSGAVAAVGTAGFFLWFANASASMARIGAQVTVSQAFGKKDYERMRRFSETSLWINIVFGALVGILLFIFNGQVISFFHLGDQQIISDAMDYLSIIALSMPFTYVNPVLGAIFNSAGNSKAPFIFNSVGLLFNIIFDILLIFGIGPFPALGVRGAAIATALAQVLVFVLLVNYNSKVSDNLRFSLKKLPAWADVYEVCRIGLPSALQATLYCCYSIFLARIIANFGPVSIAVQKIGSQIESISWMTADGLAIAATAFVGQNYGLGNQDRIKKGIRVIIGYALCFGTFAAILLIFFGRPVFSIFLQDQESLLGGISYLRILGYSQIFMSIEIVCIGIFNGHGETRLPAIISILMTGARIPLAILLSRTPLGVDGIWWAISGTSIAKGIVFPMVYLFYQRSLNYSQ